MLSASVGFVEHGPELSGGLFAEAADDLAKLFRESPGCVAGAIFGRGAEADDRAARAGDHRAVRKDALTTVDVDGHDGTPGEASEQPDAGLERSHPAGAAARALGVEQHIPSAAEEFERGLDRTARLAVAVERVGVEAGGDDELEYLVAERPPRRVLASKDVEGRGDCRSRAEVTWKQIADRGGVRVTHMVGREQHRLTKIAHVFEPLGVPLVAADETQRGKPGRHHRASRPHRPTAQSPRDLFSGWRFGPEVAAHAGSLCSSDAWCRTLRKACTY